MQRYQATYVFVAPPGTFRELVKGSVETPQWNGMHHESAAAYLQRKMDEMAKYKFIVINSPDGPFGKVVDNFVSASVDIIEEDK